MARHRSGPYAESGLLSLFPTPVWRLRLRTGERKRIERALGALLTELRAGQTPLAPGQGWQSEQGLHARIETQPLIAAIEGAAASVLRFLRITGHELEPSGC